MPRASRSSAPGPPDSRPPTTSRCSGYRVTIFEKEATAGGMLVAAIPEYRLPRATLQREIDALLNENIEVKYHQALGRDFTVDSLQEGRLRGGVRRHRRAPQQDAGASRRRRRQASSRASTSSRRYNLHGQETGQGARRASSAAATSALDAARVALRQKQVESVTVFYRRTRGEMPAYAEEIEAALEEGITIETLVAPVAVKSAGRPAHGHRVPAQRTGRARRQRPRQAGAAARQRVRRRAGHAGRGHQRGAGRRRRSRASRRAAGAHSWSTRNRRSPASRACSAAATW